MPRDRLQEVVRVLAGSGRVLDYQKQPNL